jgi:hypothetical protein
VKIRVTLTVPTFEGTAQQVKARVGAAITGQVLEADIVDVGPAGELWLFRAGLEDERIPIITFAPGTWRTVAEVGAFEAAMKAANEDTPGREEARQA